MFEEARVLHLLRVLHPKCPGNLTRAQIEMGRCPAMGKAPPLEDEAAQILTIKATRGCHCAG